MSFLSGFGGAASQPFGTTGGTGTTPNTGFSLFGTTNPQNQANNVGTSSPGPTTFTGFGAPKPSGTGGIFSQGNAANTTSATPAAASPTPNFFSNFSKPADATSSNTAPSQPSGGLFGGGASPFSKQPDAPVSTGAPTTAPTVPSLFGNQSAFGNAKQDNASKEKEKEVTPAASSTSFPSGGLFAQPSTTVVKDTASIQPANQALPLFGGNLFGASKDTTAKPDTPADAGQRNANAPLPSFSLGGTAASNKDASGTSKPDAPAAATPAPVIHAPPPSVLRGKTIEEIVNKWQSDLELHVREFNKLAGEVAVWDRTLIDNGNAIAGMYEHAQLAEREQMEIEQSLAHVEQQQKDLSATLDMYEKQAKELFDSQSGSLRASDVGPADAERDKNYMLAADLNAQLDDLSHTLSQMIESVNELSGGPQDDTAGDDPLQQISQILSSHLDSLQWIDGAVQEVETKVSDVEKRLREASIEDTEDSVPEYGVFTASTNRPRRMGFGL